MAIATRFRIKKTVGTPAIGGSAGDLESLASHATNPNAHPDYLKKSAMLTPFDGATHIASQFAHAVTNIRRAELTSTKSDYEKTRKKSLANSADNYTKTNPERYIITSFVLDQILADLGLSDTSTFLRSSMVLQPSSRVPPSGWEQYLPSYALFKPVQDQFLSWSNKDTGIAATYLSQAAARSLYAVIDHSHEIFGLVGASASSGFFKTRDPAGVAGKKYYRYNAAEDKMVEVRVEERSEIDPALNLYEDAFAKLVDQGVAGELVRQHVADVVDPAVTSLKQRAVTSVPIVDDLEWEEIEVKEEEEVVGYTYQLVCDDPDWKADDGSRLLVLNTFFTFHLPEASVEAVIKFIVKLDSVGDPTADPPVAPVWTDVYCLFTRGLHSAEGVINLSFPVKKGTKIAFTVSPENRATDILGGGKLYA